METKHNAPYLIARYEQLQRCVNNETNLLVCVRYRDEMRQIKKILLNKYRILVDKQHLMYYNNNGERKQIEKNQLVAVQATVLRSTHQRCHYLKVQVWRLPNQK